MNGRRFFFCFSTLVLSVVLPSWGVDSIIVDNETGTILEEHGLNHQVPVASLTKVAMAMVLLDWADLEKKNHHEFLNQLVEVPSDLSLEGLTNHLGLQAGDRLTLRDLLYLALLISDNEAALLIANEVGKTLPNHHQLPPIDNFVAHMNALARELNMRNTLFLNPSGQDRPSSQLQPYSTVADMARLVRYAYQKPGLPFYVAQQSREIHLEREGKTFAVTIHNSNILLGRDFIDGVKTGLTPLAGECLLLTSEHRPEVKRVGDTIYTAPRRIIVVLLHTKDRFQEGLKLLNHGWELYDAWAAAGRLTKGHQTL